MKTDRRQLNNAHASVRALGAKAARDGFPIHSCPYNHAAMRASWLKGFAQEQQLELDLGI
ncbi:CrpP family ICE-associated protein [Pseudomonas sp. NPDC088368]|uniref:CrpP family ICE-associated protein n=1 Tax=Pseudomonas sp. NPDC088368 TaxID=3364453 RepID=UPI00381F2835